MTARRTIGYRAGILVLASHNSALLERTCTKGMLLDGGKVRAYGPIGEVVREYDNGA
jgi:ABC-type polysaccharide/polyol phosphate transport system ATPase subunit